MTDANTPDPRLARFGRAVRLHRAALGMTQDALAARTSLGRSSIANIEAGRQTPPLLAALDIAGALKTSLGVLTGEVADPVVEQVNDALDEVTRLEDEMASAREALSQARARVRVMRSLT